MYLEREIDLKIIQNYIRNLLRRDFDKQPWIRYTDTLIDRDVHIADYLISLSLAPLGFLRYTIEILCSLPYKSKRLDRKYETYLLLRTLKLDYSEPSVKVTHPLKGIDFELDLIVKSLKNEDIGSLYKALWRAQINEMEDQWEDREKDSKTNQPNMFDPEIETKVRERLRRWDKFYANAPKSLKLTSLEKQWDEFKRESK